jgi:hypothetical protein
LNDITSVPNVIKIYQAVQKVLVGDTQTDWRFDKPIFILESRLKLQISDCRLPTPYAQREVTPAP